MIQGLIILSGAVPGIRDLMWAHGDDLDVIGYHVFRADNRYGPWRQLTTDPVPGNRYRDETRLDSKIYTVQDSDWVERGAKGNYVFKAPETPIYGDVVAGRAILASQPDHVTVTINGAQVPVARVDGFDGSVWLANAFRLMDDADRRARINTLPDAGSEVVVSYKLLGNFVDPTPECRAFYTVVPVSSVGDLLHDPGAVGSEIVSILEVDKMDYMQAEMVRKNAFLLEGSGEPCHLMIRRTRGVPCGCVTEGIARTGCSSCYETGIVGGYYGPYDFLFLDPDVAATVEVTEGGKKTTRQSRSWCGPTPILQAGDLIIRKNGERLVIGPPTYKSPRGVLLQQEYDATLLPYGDTRYRIPPRPSTTPTVYNPAFQASHGVAGEPVTGPASDPTKTLWENTEVPSGRTVVFQNINT